MTGIPPERVFTNSEHATSDLGLLLKLHDVRLTFCDVVLSEVYAGRHRRDLICHVLHLSLILRNKRSILSN